MTSEVENILKGRVEYTVEFEANKKVIGISQQNLIPNENGIVPLSKDGAFIKEEAITPAPAVGEIETLDFLSATTTSPASTDMNQVDTGLKVPEYSDVTVESPVEVANPKDLSDFNVTASSEVVEKPVETVVSNDYAPIDIQMPQMPDKILAEEPKELDSNLFVTPLTEVATTPEAAAETLQEPVAVPEPLPTSLLEPSIPASVEPQMPFPVTEPAASPQELAPVEPVQQSNLPVTPSNNNINDNLNKEAIDIKEKMNKTINLIKEEVNKVVSERLAELEKSLEESIVKEKPMQEVAQVALPAGDLNPLMSDALAQINNMVIPGNEGPKM